MHVQFVDAIRLRGRWIAVVGDFCFYGKSFDTRAEAMAHASRRAIQLTAH
jgi:hypothetical protein